MSEQNSQKYERFSVVSFVDQATHNIVEELRRRIPPHIAVMPAHVTVKGSFVEPASLKAVQEHIEREVNKTKLLQIQVESVSVSETHIGLRLIPNTELVDLHDRLFYALQDLVKDVYGDKPGSGYHPHMSVLYEITAAESKQALELLSDLRQIKHLELQHVNLMGRMGGAERGRWEVVHTYQMENRT